VKKRGLGLHVRICEDVIKTGQVEGMEEMRNANKIIVEQLLVKEGL
jgi:hypothetical protein